MNYRVKADMYIVDRIFDRGALILGTGKKAQRAEIIRGTAGGKSQGTIPLARLSRSRPLPPQLHYRLPVPRILTNRAARRIDHVSSETGCAIHGRPQRD